MAITFKKKYKDEMTGEWTCPVCELKMDSQHAFTVHIRQHNPTDHSHTCSICAKQLSSASSLDRHMLIHSGERPFKCRICSMAFTTNGNMHRHFRTHGLEQQQAIGYAGAGALDEDGLRVRSKKKRKSKSPADSGSPNAASQNSSFDLSQNFQENFLALLQLQQKANYDFDGLLGKNQKKLSSDDLDDSEHRSTTSSEEQQENLLNKSGSYQEEFNKLALKRSLAQNSTLYNTLLSNGFGAVANGSAAASSTNNKSDLADISSILSVISSVTPILATANAELPQLNEEQMAKFNQITQQQALHDQGALLNGGATPGKQAGKRSRSERTPVSGQLNGSLRLNGQANGGKRIKRESIGKPAEFTEQGGAFNSSLSNLSNFGNLNNLNLKNNPISSLATISNLSSLINGAAAAEEDDQRSDKSVKNSSDIENEMINGKLQSSKAEKSSTSKLNSSTTSQKSVNSQRTLEHDTMDDEEDEVNLSEEEEANKIEQEFCEQEQRELNLLREANQQIESKRNELDEEDKVNDDERDDLEPVGLTNDLLLQNGLSSLIVPKRTGGENLADLLIKSDKNNNKNINNNNGNASDLNNRVFIDPMVEDDVKLLERQLQDQQYLCKICKLEVRSVNTLRRHQRLHDSGGQLYACHYCKYTSLDKSSLIRHLRTHNGQRPYQCTICKYAFTTKANCERHVRKRHKKQTKSEIRVSMQLKTDGSAVNSDGLISLNGGALPNQPDPFASNTLDNLPPSSLVETNKLLASSNMHLIPHVFYEPNSLETSCRYCHVDFRFNRLLRQHLRTMCNNNFTKKPFNCILCNQGFTTKNVCVRHFEKNHKDVPHDQISNMIIENDMVGSNGLEESTSLNGRFSNGLNASALAAFSSTGSGSSELMSNGDSSELDQPLNLANGFFGYNGLAKLNGNRSVEKYMDDDEDEFDDEENQNALDLSVKSNERLTIDQISSMSLGGTGSSNPLNGNQLNEHSEIIRNAITTLLQLQQSFTKGADNPPPPPVPQVNGLQSLNSSLLAAQQLQSSGSLLNLFNSFNSL